MSFPTLFKRGATGAVWQWSITVNGPTKVEEWGIVGGAMQRTFDTVMSGKNLGKVNATTPETQAEAEARSAWEHKIKSGYVDSYSRAEAGESDLGGYPPMLAKVAEEAHPKYLTFPCYVQPKLDGMRCQATHTGLYSRTRKALQFPHIEAALAVLALDNPEFAHLEFDGELYLHRYADNFQELMSICRKANHPRQHTIEYWIYDIIDPVRPFSERSQILQDLKVAGHPIVIVPTVLCHNQADVDAAEARFVEEGYEGAMRRSDTPYEFKRSFNLLKIKRFQDSEFTILDVIEGRGKLAGHAGALKFETQGGEYFYAKPAMPDSTLRHIFVHPGEFIGRQATVKYQGVSADGIPRFPVVKDILV